MLRMKSIVFRSVCGRALQMLLVVALGATIEASGLVLRKTYVAGDNAAEGLRGANDVFVSGDGRFVYVTGTAGGAGGSVTWLLRDTASNALKQIDMIKNGSGGVGGMRNPGAIVSDKEGLFLYILSAQDSSIAVFMRDEAIGALTYRGSTGDKALVNEPIAAAVSPDGMHLYASTRKSSGVAVFVRSPATGMLTYSGRSDPVFKMEAGEDISLSHDGKSLYTVSSADSALHWFWRNPQTGQLLSAGELIGGNGASPWLRGVHCCRITADDKYLYVGSDRDSSISWLLRDTLTGAVTYGGTVRLGHDGIPPLAAGSDLALSADSKYLYALAQSSNAIVCFVRNSSSGAISYLAHLAQWQGGVSDLEGPRHVAVVPNSQAVYVTASGSEAISCFAPKPETERLTFGGSTTMRGLDGLRGATDMVWSRDGKFLYVSAYLDNSVTCFSRTDDGSLVQQQCIRGSAVGAGILDGASSVAMSTDQKTVYVSGAIQNTISWFARSMESGYLTYVGSMVDGAGGVDGLWGIGEMEVSPNGRQLYAACANDKSVVWCDRDTATGSLMFRYAQRGGGMVPTTLDEEKSIVMSPDGRDLYVADDHGLFHFKVSPSGSLLYESLYPPSDETRYSLFQASDVKVTSDGSRVYVSCLWMGDALVALNRDTATGRLDFSDKWTQFGLLGLSLSPDQQHAYAYSPDGKVCQFACPNPDLASTLSILSCEISINTFSQGTLPGVSGGALAACPTSGEVYFAGDGKLLVLTDSCVRTEPAIVPAYSGEGISLLCANRRGQGTISLVLNVSKKMSLDFWKSSAAIYVCTTTGRTVAATRLDGLVPGKNQLTLHATAGSNGAFGDGTYVCRVAFAGTVVSRAFVLAR